jgi:hypothetical protein
MLQPHLRCGAGRKGRQVNPISPAALRRLQVLYRQASARSLDMDNTRDERIAWASRELGREITSFSQLSVHDGKLLIDRLQAELGVPETAAPRRRPVSYKDAQKMGTEGRHDQIHAESTMLDGTEQVFDLIRHELTVLGWDADRLRTFLKSGHGPNGGRDTIRTLGDANRVHYALKRMAERVAKKASAA